MGFLTHKYMYMWVKALDCGPSYVTARFYHSMEQGFFPLLVLQNTLSPIPPKLGRQVTIISAIFLHEKSSY